ncbi:quinone-dependent dihydroorotate dehydrogenase [Patescibacteria group bacterium]|nr:quinone-dependent dihydroorotate dehydrogenase [Patescibacteria group bacterium]
MIRALYRHGAKPFFFAQDPEDVHDRMCELGQNIGRFRVTRWLARKFFRYENNMLEQDIWGIRFSNPIGLAAGFDKNAHLTAVLPSVGFGFEEVGSITGERCEGNPRPRLWRLPQSRGLVVYYGLKNDGCEAIAARLHEKRFAIPIGISVAKTNSPETVDVGAGIADYVKAFRAFLDIGQYFTINISCPNTFGGEPFTDPARLHLLLTEIDKIETQKPILLKMPADITTEQLDALVTVANQHRVHGFILSNLTKAFDRSEIHSDEIKGMVHGGISGKPTFQASNELLAHLYKTVGKRYVIIGCGGVFSAEDAYEKICQGASLIQLITGMIFEGPQCIGEINRGIVELLKRDGFKTVSEAVGSRF